MTIERTPVRIHKYLADQGLYSRREAEELVMQGLVTIDDQPAEVGQLVIKGQRIRVYGKTIHDQKPPKVYWLLHKPKGFLTSSNPEGKRKCIYDLQALRSLPFRVNPVGRLDYATEGLLLLTNDGDLTQKLLHPSFEIPRTYIVLVSKRLSPKSMREINKGITLTDGLVRAKVLEGHAEKTGHGCGISYYITVYEGRNRLVRRLFESLGHDIERLIRISHGSLRLPEDLLAGHYRQLTAKEVQELKRL